MPPTVSLVYELVFMYDYYPKIIFFVHYNELYILELKSEPDCFHGH